MDRHYLKGLIESDLIHADRCLKDLKYSEWSEADTTILAQYFENRKRKAEYHIKLLNGSNRDPITMVPAMTDAERRG